MTKDRVNHLDHWLVFIALLLGGGAIVQTAWEYLSSPSGVPVVMERSEAMNSPVHAGENLLVRVWREKTRDDCPVSSEPLAVHTATGSIISLRNSTSLGGPAGVPYVDLTYPMPEYMMGGEYELRDTLAYLCPERTYIVVQPPLNFEITR